MMPADVAPEVWLGCGYSVVLLGVAYLIDAMARRASKSRQLSSTNGFHYHADHDAWLCPEDQWLWPTSFDPENRVMRYRATPSVCNSCPVKDTCTTSASGREVTRAVDPWPASEAARFHRGIACAVVVIAVIWPLATALAGADGVGLVLLLATCGLVTLGGLPLFRHFHKTPAAFPHQAMAGVPVRSLDENVTARVELAVVERGRRSKYRSRRLAEADRLTSDQLTGEAR